MDTPKGINIGPKTHKAAQDQEESSNPLPWRMHKGRTKPRQSQRPRWARGRLAGLALATAKQNQLPTDSWRGSEPLSKRRWPHGGTPRPAGPTWKPLRLGLGVEAKHNHLTCFQPTLPTIPASYRPWKTIKGGHQPSLQHTPLELLSLHLYFLE